MAPYRIEYSPEAEEHLKTLTARERAMVVDEVDEQLAHQPTEETRNRKPMRPNPLASWELRFGAFRVYYDAQDEPEQVVYILAVGFKDRDRILIAGEVIEL